MEDYVHYCLGKIMLKMMYSSEDCSNDTIMKSLLSVSGLLSVELFC